MDKAGRKSSGILAASMFVGLAALSAPSHAQNIAVPPPQDSPVKKATPVSAAPEAGDPGLDIVVTAQRREERLSNVPISITAISGDALTSAGITSTRDLTQVTPGLVFQSVGSSAQPFLRGIGSTGASIGDSSNVAIYVDGVYQPFQAANYLQFVDLERIEVLKGPQGILFGRNAAGGAISVTTKAPSFDPTGRFGISYGRFNEIEGTAYVSAPLVADKIAFRLSANLLKGGAFRRDINLNRDMGYKRYGSYRAKLLVKASDAVDILFSGFYTGFNDLSTFGNQPLDGNTRVRALAPDILIPTRKNTSALDIVPSNKVRNYGGSMLVTAEFDWATLTSLTAFSRGHQAYFTDSDLTPASFSQSDGTFDDDMVSQDLTLTSTSRAPVGWVLGATYYRERGTSRIRSNGGLLVTSPNPPLTFGVDVPRIAIDAYAVFGELTYRLAPRVTVVGGLRYSRDEPSFSGNAIIVATNSPAATVGGSDSFNSLTPRVSVRYEITDRTNMYASYSKGFKSGVFNANSLQIASVRPETIDAYEVGIKGAPSRTLTFDAAAYFYDYKNLQFAAFGATTLQPTLRNAAQARIYGGEANASVIATPGLTLRAGLAYTHGEYSDFPGAQGFRPAVDANGVPVGGNVSFAFDASGQRLIRTPRIQTNATIAYATDLANDGSINADITGSYNSEIRHDLAGNFRQSPYSIVNTSLSYVLPDGHVRGTVFATNILSSLPIAGILISQSTTSVTYQRPAQYGVRLEYMF